MILVHLILIINNYILEYYTKKITNFIQQIKL
jgi:hypothetical protein